MSGLPDTIAEARALGPVAICEACLARARATASLGAFALLDEDGARAQAAALEGAEPRGPLHGIPVGVKDIIDVEGLPTRAGSGLTDAAPAARDAPIVARLRAAGAVVLGKTTTHELAFGVTTPAAANPRDPSRSAGGSSGGSAVAVATGAVYAALGTDTAGSVRLPAAFCGVYGLKARPDALPMEGILPLAPSMDSAGCFARRAEDLALVWSVLGGDEAELDAAPRERPSGRMSGRGDSSRRSREIGATGAALRVGVPDPWPDADDEFSAAVRRAAAALGDPIAVAVPAWSAWVRPRGRTLVAEALDAHRAAGWYPARAADYGAEPLGYLRAAERLSSGDRAAARGELAALVDGFRAALAVVDVLVLPASPVPPPARDADPARASVELTPLVGPAGAAGMAAASVPCGTTGDGLPIGAQLVGADERAVLSAVLRLTAVEAASAR